MPGKLPSRPQSAFIASDEHERLRIAVVCTVVTVAALDAILAAFALALATHRERTER